VLCLRIHLQVPGGIWRTGDENGCPHLRRHRFPIRIRGAVSMPCGDVTPFGGDGPTGDATPVGFPHLGSVLCEFFGEVSLLLTYEKARYFCGSKVTSALT